jgi:D-methionine transport system ATP-binding protein
VSESASEKEIIRIENLSKVYHGAAGEVVALKDINLSIREGEIFGIIGLSGAGKSTLVRCVNYLERPTSGRVIIEGNDLSALSNRELLRARQKIGMIFQEFNLLSQRNAMGNVCYPMEIAGVSRADAKKRALELLNMVGLSNRAKAYPSQMSGGQKQRVAIARALAMNPKVLLCDEATSALDPTTTQSILELLQDINHRLGVTILIVTHEMRVIEQICQRVAVIDQSHIVEMGDVKEIFVHPQSTIAKQLIFPQGQVPTSIAGNSTLRIVFDGMSALEPIISKMVLECHITVNILYAHTKVVEGKTFGQMVIRLPEDQTSVARIKAYLNDRKIYYKEEPLHE